MSSEPTTPPGEVAVSWPVLSVVERRLLGVLVEKAKTTPDNYPLSVNALVTGCNQKSNREPILNLSEPEVEGALTALQAKGLTTKITGGRVVRWRHNLYDVWNVDKVELAVLAELLLRGPQTEGELRGRASRMEPIDDLDTLRSFLRRLAQRGLVVFLSPEGRRGTLLTHGFHAEKELEHLRTQHGSGALLSEEPAPAAAPRTTADGGVLATVQARLESAEGRIQELTMQVSNLQVTVAGLSEQLRLLKEALGANDEPEA